MASLGRERIEIRRMMDFVQLPQHGDLMFEIVNNIVGEFRGEENSDCAYDRRHVAYMIRRHVAKQASQS